MAVSQMSWNKEKGMWLEQEASAKMPPLQVQRSTTAPADVDTDVQ
jgi:hypothetical protein